MAEICVPSPLSKLGYVQSNDDKVAFKGTNADHNNLSNKVTPTNGQNLKGASETVEVRHGLQEFQFSF